MKTVSNSAFKVRLVEELAQEEVTGVSRAVPSVDAGTNLFRTRILNVMLRVLSAGQLTSDASSIQPFSVFIVDMCGDAVISAMENPTAKKCFEAGYLGWSVDVGVNTDGTDLYPSGMSGGVLELNLIAKDLDSTIGGSFINVWFFGASVPIVVGVEVLAERVSITSEEYIANFAKGC